MEAWWSSGISMSDFQPKGLSLVSVVMLFHLTRNFTPYVSLNPGVKMCTCNTMLGSNLGLDWHPIQGGVVILLVASCYGNRVKLRQL